jgi:hypothetical protein
MRRGEVYPTGCCVARWWKILKVDSGGQAAPGPGLHRWCCGVGGGLQPEGEHLVLLFTNAEGEMVQGSAKEGVGAIIEQLEQRDMAVPPVEHCRRASQGIWQLRRAAAGPRQYCV